MSTSDKTFDFYACFYFFINFVYKYTNMLMYRLVSTLNSWITFTRKSFFKIRFSNLMKLSNVIEIFELIRLGIKRTKMQNHS